MNHFTGVNIDRIYIIVHKKEQRNFSFYNPYRNFDGFVLITSGSGYAVTPDGKKQKIEKDDILILRKGDKYQIYFEEECSYITSGYDISFDDEKEFPVDIPYIIHCSANMVKSIYRLNDIWQSRKTSSYSLSRAYLIEMYMEFVDDISASFYGNNMVSDAITYIHDNFKTNFSGDDIAAYCSVSKSYLRAKFLKHTGTTIIKYRDNLRIAAAKELLDSNHFSITEIASELGYYDIYHFSKTFKKIMGISPQKYARQ